MQIQEPIQTLPSSLFLNMVKAGAREIISNESLLNKLNVFPVTDHDTGSNMSSLMRMIVSQNYSTKELSIMLKQLADASLIGACGNSGMIFSAFFVGLSSNQNTSTHNEFTIEEFINSIRLGVKRAYHAVSEPVEGTILSVMSAWSSACAEAFKQSDDFVTILKNSLAKTEEVLKKTKQQLAILEQHHIVDAGALGFVKFINGMYNYLVNPDVIESEVVTEGHVGNETFSNHWHSEQSDYQYCMETLLEIDREIDTSVLKSSLQPYCDSIVVNQSANYLKIHLHASDIQKITDLLQHYGNISHQKIDDMQKQWEITHARKFPIAVVTDSSADLPAQFIREHQIHILPVQVRVGNHSLQDGLTIDLNKLSTVKAKDPQLETGTASPSPETIARILRFLAVNYESIIIISLSAKLSSTYQTILNQARMIPSTKIDVIDSRTVSAAQGLLVMKAASMVAKGYDHDGIVARINMMRNSTKVFAIVSQFKTLLKSGRMPTSFGWLAKLTKFHPIISINAEGKTALAKFAFGRNMSWRRMVSVIKALKKSFDIKTAAIIYTTDDKTASAFASYIEAKTKIKLNFITQASCSLGLHTGSGYIGIAVSDEMF